MPDTLTAARDIHASLIRNEPMQARSTARLAALLDAAAAVVAEIGYERLTTAMVAEGAGASIGTVYRYFPDRIAVLQSLAARNEERITDRISQAIADPKHSTWRDALTGAFEVYVGFFRDETGFASLRLGDVLDLRPADALPRNSVLAATILDALVTHFDIVADERMRLGFDIAFEALDALIARAFARDPQGDPERLKAGCSAVHNVLADYLEYPAE